MSEYWLIDGQAVAADGDIGDMDHEMYAWQYLHGMFVDECQGTEALDRLADLLGSREDNDPTEFRTIVCDWADVMDREGGMLSPEAVADPYYYFESVLGWEHKKMMQLTDSNLRSDIRLYAARYWQWVRLQGYDLEAYRLDRTLLEKIADGLYDALGEIWTDTTYSLYEHATGRMFNDVHAHVFEAGSMSGLRTFSDNRESERVGT